MSTIPVSPANGATPLAGRKRVSMSVPQQRLAAAEIPGYYLYWMKGTPDRLSQALNAGYEFVTSGETLINNTDIGGDAKNSGNTDMGTRVSVVTGDELDSENQPMRLYLMKIKEEWHQEDLALQQKGNERFISTLKAGQVGAENDKDANSRYVGPQTNTNMFTPKPIRRA